MKCVCCKWVGW